MELGAIEGDSEHRRRLLKSLVGYRARYPNEGEVVDRVSALVGKHGDCFDRSCRPGHITGSAWVLSADRRRCLLLHHRKLDRWLQPGGHADGDPDVLAVAIREVQEESGLKHLEVLDPSGRGVPFDIDVHLIPARRDAQGILIEDTHEHHDIRFLLAAQVGESITVSAESRDIRWVTPQELVELTTEESVLRMLDKARPHMIAGK